MESPVTLAAAGLLVVLTAAGAGPAAPAASEREPRVTHGTLAPLQRVLWDRLAARLAAAEQALDGVAGLAVEDLTSGARIELHAERVLPSASVIKSALLYELYLQAEEGRLDLDEVTTPPLPRAGGGGVLQELSGRVSLTWRDLALLMMGFSDNAATNVLIDRLGQEAVNRRLAALGLHSTLLRRRMLDLAAARRGDENVTSAADLLVLMRALHGGRGLSPARAAELLRVAAVAKLSPFRDVLPPDLRVADKPGELEGVRGVAALVLRPGRPYAAAVLTSALQRESAGEDFIRGVSRALYETGERLARASPYGRLLGD